MPAKKFISKEDCLRAMKFTRSVKAAARYLNCSYQHLKPYMKSYKDEETGLSLFELHKNQSGKGIPKFLSNTPFGKKLPAIEDIVNGKADASSFNPEKLKHAMIEAGYMLEQCYYCGYGEQREIDGKTPLLMTFVNGHKYDFTNNNAQMICYNCHFLRVGNVYSENDIEEFESHQTRYKKSDNADLQLDDYTKKRLQEIEGNIGSVSDDPYDLVSRKK